MSTREYLESNKDNLLPEQLLHYFNNDFSTASTALDIIRKELELSGVPQTLGDLIERELFVATERLANVYHIGNIALSRWMTQESK